MRKDGKEGERGIGEMAGGRGLGVEGRGGRKRMDEENKGGKRKRR